MSDIRNAEELAVVLSEKLDDDAPLNLHSRWRPLAAELWARMGLPGEDRGHARPRADLGTSRARPRYALDLR